ncbi:MAG: hypothetical protein H7Y42_05315 [Chitinophagaceae bacterium]|nr:hypothetical protein [Chitinophagaceae bacterium]
MTNITDEFMYSMFPKSREYCMMILRPGPNADQEGVEKLIWEHGRRNFALRADGQLSIVCPVTIESNISGMGIFNTSIDDTRKLMEEDPAVQAGVFVFELHPILGFPGDNLPGE